VRFYRPEDQAIRRFLGAGGAVDVEDLEQVGKAVAKGKVDPAVLGEDLDLSRSRVLGAVTRLEEVGFVEVSIEGEVLPAEDAPPLEEAIEQGAEASEERQEYERSRLEMMRSYAETTGCRRDFVLSYFGEDHEAPTATTATPAWSSPRRTSSAPSRSAPPSPTASGAPAKSNATTATAWSSSSSPSATAPWTWSWSRRRTCCEPPDDW
jgi:hypothetical protein